MIDTHAHIYASEFDADRAEVVARARAAGVEHVILPNEGVGSIPLLYVTEEGFPGFCSLAMGLHPEEVREDYKECLGAIRREFERRRFVAVGEVGLDFYWDVRFKEEQLFAFERQVEWALEYGIPLIVHTRKAWDECLGVLQRYVGDGVRGVFHCFDGDAAVAHEVVSMGFYVGVGGLLTFKNSHLPEVLCGVPLGRVLLETDAPYLAPVPHRGKRNEPSFMRQTLERLAAVYGVTTDEVERITTENAKNVFSL